MEHVKAITDTQDDAHRAIVFYCHVSVIGSLVQSMGICQPASHLTEVAIEDRVSELHLFLVCFFFFSDNVDNYMLHRPSKNEGYVKLVTTHIFYKFCPPSSVAGTLKT